MKHVVGDINKHLSHYLVLLLILSLGALAFVYFRHAQQIQIVSAFLTASFYALWGVIHHNLEGDLHVRIVLEYVAVALLGFLILLSVAMRV